MRYSYLKDPSGAYPKVLVLISIALGYLDWDNNLIVIYKVFYWGADFSVRRNILLYYLLIMFVQALRVPNRSIFIKEVFSLGLRDLIRLLINIKLFQPISFI